MIDKSLRESANRLADSLESKDRKGEALAIRMDSIAMAMADLVTTFANDLAKLDLDAPAKLLLGGVTLGCMQQLNFIMAEMKQVNGQLKRHLEKVL